MSNCENHPDRPAIGITGNEQPFCGACLRAEWEYARAHVREDAGSWRMYVAECAARLNG